ncbi:MAG: hypothetical protein JWQ43_157 [Glaciihabitans sp.]|nr:hypothetical protein [Glaciihabitans sp.]
MLIAEVVRRFGLFVLGAALLIVGIVLAAPDPFYGTSGLIMNDPAAGEPGRYATYLPDDGVNGSGIDPFLLHNAGIWHTVACIAVVALAILLALRRRGRRAGEAENPAGS